MKFCATFLSLCDDDEKEEDEEREERRGGGGGGGRTGHAWRKHGGKRMRWSDKQPPTFDHRLVSWIHFNAPRRTAFRGSFHFTSYRSRVTLRSKWRKRSRLIFFVSLLFVERISE